MMPNADYYIISFNLKMMKFDDVILVDRDGDTLTFTSFRSPRIMSSSFQDSWTRMWANVKVERGGIL